MSHGTSAGSSKADAARGEGGAAGSAGSPAVVVHSATDTHVVGTTGSVCIVIFRGEVHADAVESCGRLLRELVRAHPGEAAFFDIIAPKTPPPGGAACEIAAEAEARPLPHGRGPSRLASPERLSPGATRRERRCVSLRRTRADRRAERTHPVGSARSAGRRREQHTKRGRSMGVLFSCGAFIRALERREVWL